jgi:hypothetical protein
MAKKDIALNQDRNGVRVRVTKYAGGGSTVDASCQCFGMEFRVHSTSTCPNRLRLIAEHERKRVLNSYIDEVI